MARAKPRIPAATADGVPILPRDLTVRPTSAEDSRAFNHERARWFRDHGINPGDWSRVYPVLKASWKAHGIDSASDRARKRLQPKGTP